MPERASQNASIKAQSTAVARLRRAFATPREVFWGVKAGMPDSLSPSQAVFNQAAAPWPAATPLARQAVSR